MLKLKKLLSLATAVCVAVSVMLCCAVNASAATMVRASVYAENTELYSLSDKVKVNIDLTGIPYTGIAEPCDVVLVIDRSGSMMEEYDAMIDAAKEFAKKLDLNTHRIGIVDYESNAYSYGFSDSYSTIEANLEALRAKGPSGSTAMDKAINSACSLIVSKRADAHAAIVLMTDGSPDNESNARAAAETAKKKGYAFYTVALCENETSSANVMLKSMATSESSHYSVFAVSRLNSVYSSIASKIGNINAKKIVVTQKISDEFSFVAGSADNTIPSPTSITSDSIRWDIHELSQGNSTLSYELQLKSEYTPYALYCGEGTVEYTDYEGNVQTINLRPQTIHNNIISDVVINSVAPAQGETDVKNVVTITGEGFIGTSIYYERTLLSPSSYTVDPQGTTLTVTLPAKNSEGSYTIKIENDRNKSASVEYTLVSNDPPKLAPVITDISPRQIPKKTKTTVTITGENLDKTQTKIGNVLLTNVTISPDGTSITGTVPAQSSLGTKTIKVSKNGKSATVDIEVVDPAAVAVPVPVINSITPDEIVNNTTSTLVITGENLNEVSTVTLKKGRVKYNVLSKTVQPDGTQMTIEVNLKNNGTYNLSLLNSKSKGSTVSFTVADMVYPDMTFTNISDITTVGNKTTVKIQGTNIIDVYTVMVGRVSISKSNYTVSADGTEIAITFTSVDNAKIRVTTSHGKIAEIQYVSP